MASTVTAIMIQSFAKKPVFEDHKVSWESNFCMLKELFSTLVKPKYIYLGQIDCSILTTLEALWRSHS
jgi:hypothetical protein